MSLVVTVAFDYHNKWRWFVRRRLRASIRKLPVSRINNYLGERSQ